MKQVLAFFIKSKNNINYSNSVISRVAVFIFSFLLLELVLWITLSNNVYDRRLLGQMLFGFCNLVLIAAVSFYLLNYKKRVRDIGKLLPDINSYKRIYYSFQDEILLDHILIKLLKGRFSSVDYEGYFNNNTLLDFSKEYRVIIFVPENEYDNVMEAFKVCSLSFNDISRENLTTHMLEMDNILVGICFPKKGNIFDKDKSWLEMSRYMSYAQVKVAEKVDIHLNAASSGRHSGLAGLKHGFSEAFEAYEYQKIYDDENSLIFYNNIKFENKEDYSSQDDTWYELERKFLHSINIEDFENSAKILDEIIEFIGNSKHIDFQMMKYKVFGLFNSLYINILERKDVGDELLNINAVYHISNCKSISELQSKVKIIYKALEMRLIHDESNFTSNHRIQEIVNYLHKNYRNPDLTIVGVADEFHISHSFLILLLGRKGI